VAKNQTDTLPEFGVWFLKFIYSYLRIMNRWRYFLTGLCMWVSMNTHAQTPVRDSSLPDFSLPDSSGRLICFSQFEGKVVLLDFWGSWCQPCRSAFEGLRRVHQKFADSGLVIIGISVDAQRRQWLKALHEEQLPWLQLNDTRRTNVGYGLLAVKGLPTLLLIDKKGRLRYRDLQGLVLDSVVKALLEEKGE
jgi:peroxiredoxin